jgi:hypothetical protein
LNARLLAATGIAATGIAAMMISTACYDYTHTNPFDPATPATASIVGPDTLYSLSQLIQYTVQGDPPFTDSLALWSASDPDALRGGTSVCCSLGYFQLFHAPLYPQTETITISIAIGEHSYTPIGALKEVTSYRRSYSRTIIVTQRLVRLRLRCPAADACDTVTVGGALSIAVDGFDALNAEIDGLGSQQNANPLTGTPIATFVSRDTTIVGIAPVGVRVANASGRKSGSAWVVAMRIAATDTLRDSVRVVVH